MAAENKAAENKACLTPDYAEEQPSATDGEAPTSSLGLVIFLI